ncbi:MAG: nucleoside-triphosphatase [Candidatus Helarchaeota archaeon]
MNIIIQGKPRSGKSTLIERVRKELLQIGENIGGVSTPELREGGRRVGFEIIDLLSGSRGILAHKWQAQGPRVGSYRVNLTDLVKIGVRGIEQALQKEVKVIIIDEIGKMELFAPEFQTVVLKALDRQAVLGTMGYFTHPFLTKLQQRSDVKFFTLTSGTREQVFNEVKALMVQGTL